MNIFISYSSLEKEAALEKRELLINNGFSVWMAPESIPYGENYMSEIPAAIEECDVFLLLLSEKSQSSKWVFREFEMALKLEKTVIPYVLEEFHLNKTYDFGLAGCQFIPAYENPLEALKKLIERVKELATDSAAEVKENEEKSVVDTPEIKSPEVLLEELKKSVPEENDTETNTVTDVEQVVELIAEPNTDPIDKNANDDYTEENSDELSSKTPDLHLKNNAAYYGDVVNGKACGKGIIIYNNGNVYKGYVNNGKPNGKGRMTYAIGGYAKGDFVDGMIHGKAEVQYKNGRIFNGNFENGTAKGHGKILYKNGNIYEGNVSRGIPKGNGKMFFAHNNETYSGHFREGFPSGQGKSSKPDGENYVGVFKKGKRHGQGKLTCPNGDVYTGEFKEGLMDGIMVVTPVDGKSYKATFEKGKMLKRTKEYLPDNQ